MRGYSAFTHQFRAQMPSILKVQSLLQRWSSNNEHKEDAAGEALRIHRLICLVAILLSLAFGAAYKITDQSSNLASWLEIPLALGGISMLAVSYKSKFARDHFLKFVWGFCYLTTFWFITLAALNDFSPNYAVGLFFIIPGIGMGYSVSLHKVWPLAGYFIISVCLTALALYLTPDTATVLPLFITSLAGISLVTLLVASTRMKAYTNFIVNEKRYRAVVEQSSDGIFLLDAQSLCFLEANPAFQDMFGRSLQELRHMTICDLVKPDRDDYRGKVEYAFLNKQSNKSERKLFHKDGTEICVELHIDRINYGNREVLCVVAHDISLRKQYEERILTAKNKAEDIARFKSTILANMSHEIRTPLSSILGWSSILADEVTDEQRELMGHIEESGKRLNKTLNAVLELACLDANCNELQPSIVNVFEETGEVLGQFSQQTREKGVAMIVKKPRQSVWVNVDASCLRRILTHLIDNAVKFTDKGQVLISIDTRDRDLSISVKDTGIGISNSFLPHLFGEFKQESEGLTREHGGNGLGLTITKRLVTLLGGDLSVETKKDVGSCFMVHLPGIVLSNNSMNINSRVA